MSNRSESLRSRGNYGNKMAAYQPAGDGMLHMKHVACNSHLFPSFCVNTAADCSLFKRFLGRRSTGGVNGVALGNYILTNFSLHNYVLTSPWVGLCLLGAKDGRENKFL